MKKELISMFAATVVAIGAATAADQDTPPAGTDAMFKALDKDGDQRLSKSEVAKDETLMEHFAALDTDGDGYLTTREYASQSKKMESKEKSN
jgi:Ca2+-binding EF-hand superfamily protein